MKNIKLSIVSIVLLTGISLSAQDLPSEGITEVTEKTLTMQNGEETIKNSVRVTTTVKNAVMVDKQEKDVNRKRIFPPKLVVKMVEIDNDADNLYDEKIRFSYMTEERTDFTLVSKNDKVMLAVENGENITVLENKQLFKANQSDNATYVFTSDDGDKIEFRIEKNLNSRNSK